MKKEKILTREDVKELPEVERLKYEVAEELGVLDKVFLTGWKSLSAKESGQIGGILSSRRKKRRKLPKA